MYKVIKYFTDLQDNSYPYEIGSTYPRKGFKATESRINELKSSNNKQGTPLIEEVTEDTGIDIPADADQINTEAAIEEISSKPKKKGRRNAQNAK